VSRKAIRSTAREVSRGLSATAEPVAISTTKTITKFVIVIIIIIIIVVVIIVINCEHHKNGVDPCKKPRMHSDSDVILSYIYAS